MDAVWSVLANCCSHSYSLLAHLLPCFAVRRKPWGVSSSLHSKGKTLREVFPLSTASIAWS